MVATLPTKKRKWSSRRLVGAPLYLGTASTSHNIDLINKQSSRFAIENRRIVGDMFYI
jgi:hypothetical protein